jgi:hypothetical protein
LDEDPRRDRQRDIAMIEPPRGKHLGRGQKGVACVFACRAGDKTLTDAE